MLRRVRAVVAVAAVVPLLSGCFVGERDGFAVSAPSCSMGPGNDTVLVELTLAPLETYTRSLTVDTLPAELSFDGIATLPQGVTLATATDAQLTDARAQIDGTDRFGHVTDEPTTVVISLRRAGEDVVDATLPTLPLWWSSGEPAFVQSVPLDLELGADSCSVG